MESTSETVHGPATRLSRDTMHSVLDEVIVPGYDPSTVKCGIVHFGPGNFMKSHLASYINQVLEVDPSWGIIAVSRKQKTVEALREQDGLFALIEREGTTRKISVLAPIVRAINSVAQSAEVIAAIANPDTRMVTMTISNHGYYLDGDSLNFFNPDILHDSTRSGGPYTIYGFLLAGILKRRDESGKPLVVMSLDNIEQNGETLKKAFLEFVDNVEPSLREWIEENVDFPVTLVDRITPVPDNELRAEAGKLLGLESKIVVGTEKFRQLVVERCRFEIPDWEQFGVQMVDDCSQYWQWKFYCVNAAHQVVGIVWDKMPFCDHCM